MPESVFLEHPEYLYDYLPWNPMVKEYVNSHPPFSI